MLSRTTDAFVLVCAKNRVLGAIGTTKSIFGFTADELVGRSFSRFVPPDRRREYRLRLVRMLRRPIEESRVTMELQMQHADGRVLTCDANGATLVADGRRVGRLILLRHAASCRA